MAWTRDLLSGKCAMTGPRALAQQKGRPVLSGSHGWYVEVHMALAVKPSGDVGDPPWLLGVAARMVCSPLSFRF